MGRNEMNIDDALKLAERERIAGYIDDYYVTPQCQSIIAVTSQGEYVFWRNEDET